MALKSFVLAALMLQAPAAPPPAAEAQGAQPPATSDAPKPVDELVVPAPAGTYQAPSYEALARSGVREFKAELERKERLRKYRASGSMEDYPGLRCVFFRRHC